AHNGQCPPFGNIKRHPINSMDHHPIACGIAFTQRKMDLEVAYGKYGCLLCVTHSLSRIANMMCIASDQSDSEAGNYPNIYPSQHCSDQQKDNRYRDPRPKARYRGFRAGLGALRRDWALVRADKQLIPGYKDV